MRTMMRSDLMALKSAFLQMAGIAVVIAVALSVAFQSTAASAAALVAMMPFLFMFSLAVTDEQNDWQSFRLTLPITRRQVVWGRYAFLALIALGCAVATLVILVAVMAVAQALAGTLTVGEELLLTGENMMLALAGMMLALVVVFAGMAFSLPPILRFGMTKATRIVPVVIVLVLTFGISFIGTSDIVNSEVIGGILVQMSQGPFLFGGILMVVAIALYAASAFVSVKLYESRGF